MKNKLHIKISRSSHLSLSQWHSAIPAVLLTAPRVPREQPVQAGAAAAGSFPWALLGLCLLQPPVRSACRICRLCTREGQSQGGAADLQVQSSGAWGSTAGAVPSAETPTCSWGTEGTWGKVSPLPAWCCAHLRREGLMCIEGRKEANQGPRRCVGHGIARE